MKKYLKKIVLFFSQGREKSFLTPIENWLKNPQNKDFFDNLNQLWEIVRMRASTFNPDKHTAWEKINSHIAHSSKKKKRTLSTRTILTSAASVAAILFSFWFFNKQYLSNSAQSEVIYYTTHAGKAEILLPDGSKVWLDNNSSLSYSELKDERIATLQGEGYFDVSKKDKKFKVNTQDLDIVVYGTKFNVVNRTTQQNIEVALIEGKVALKNELLGEKKLLPGELALYDKKSEQVTITSSDVKSATVWANEALNIENKTFGELVKILSIWYKKPIQVSEELKHVGKYTFKITDESIYDIIHLLSKTYPIQYKEEKDGRIIILKKVGQIKK